MSALTSESPGRNMDRLCSRQDCRCDRLRRPWKRRRQTGSTLDPTILCLWLCSYCCRLCAVRSNQRSGTACVNVRRPALTHVFHLASPASVPFLGLVKRNMHVHLVRHFTFIDALPSVKTAQAAFNAANKSKIKARTANATFELGLPNAQMGKVVTRFPPEPSGFLHIGHAKAAILNQYFAQHYQGKFIIRFDDTNPSKESEEFQDSILEDLLLMGLKGDMMTYTSNYFNELYDYALKMIKAGKAYTDDTAQEKMRAERMDGIASAHRDDSVEDNLAHFEEMKQGTEAGLKWCLRAKISVDDPNKAMRDPVIYRCNLQPHHRTGTQWKIYPGYDFACPVVDCIEGVTHALRTNEYRDRNPQYWWMLEALGLRKVEIWDFGRLSFVYTLLSKRKLKAMVEEKGMVTGWDDPRFPTIRGKLLFLLFFCLHNAHYTRCFARHSTKRSYHRCLALLHVGSRPIASSNQSGVG